VRDALEVLDAAPVDHAHHLGVLGEEEIRQVGAVQAGDAADEGGHSLLGGGGAGKLGEMLNVVDGLFLRTGNESCTSSIETS
jgi:hypothetical protein